MGGQIYLIARIIFNIKREFWSVNMPYIMALFDYFDFLSYSKQSYRKQSIKRKKYKRNMVILKLPCCSLKLTIVSR